MENETNTDNEATVTNDITSKTAFQYPHQNIGLILKPIDIIVRRIAIVAAVATLPYIFLTIYLYSSIYFYFVGLIYQYLPIIFCVLMAGYFIYRFVSKHNFTNKKDVGSEVYFYRVVGVIVGIATSYALSYLIFLTYYLISTTGINIMPWSTNGLDSLAATLYLIFICVVVLTPSVIYLCVTEGSDRIYAKFHGNITEFKDTNNQTLINITPKPIDIKLYRTAIVLIIASAITSIIGIPVLTNNYYIDFAICTIIILVMLYLYLSRRILPNSINVNNKLFIFRTIGFCFGVACASLLSVVVYYIHSLFSTNYGNYWTIREFTFWTIYTGGTIYFPCLIYIFGIEIADRYYVKKFNSKK